MVVVVDGELQVRSATGPQRRRIRGRSARLETIHSREGVTHLDSLLIERHGVSEDSDGAVGEGEMPSAHVANAANRV